MEIVSSDVLNSGDIKAIMNIYEDDAIFLNGTVKICGKNSLSSAFTYMFQHIKNFNFYNGVSSVSKHMVSFEGLFTFDWYTDNNSSFAKGVMTIVYKKQADSSYKITCYQENHGNVLRNRFLNIYPE